MLCVLCGLHRALNNRYLDVSALDLEEAYTRRTVLDCHCTVSCAAMREWACRQAQMLCVAIRIPGAGLKATCESNAPKRARMKNLAIESAQEWNRGTTVGKPKLFSRIFK